MQSTLTLPKVAGGGIYIVWLSDTHFYGGKAKTFRGRWQCHLRELQAGVHGNERIQRVFNLYGRFEPQVVTVVPAGVSRREAEQAWLDENYGKPGCLNICAISEEPPTRLGKVNSPEHRAKIAAGLRGKKLSVEHRLILSESHKGKTHSMEQREKIRRSCLGKNVGRHPAERNQKNREGHLGLKASPETRAKMSDVQAERWSGLSPEQKAAQLANLSGNAMTGRKHSDETRRKMREAHARRKERLQLAEVVEAKRP